MASSKNESTIILIKWDRIGRHQYTQDYKAEVSAAYETSGMSGDGAAGLKGISWQ